MGTLWWIYHTDLYDHGGNDETFSSSSRFPVHVILFMLVSSEFLVARMSWICCTSETVGVGSSEQAGGWGLLWYMACFWARPAQVHPLYKSCPFVGAIKLVAFSSTPSKAALKFGFSVICFAFWFVCVYSFLLCVRVRIGDPHLSVLLSLLKLRVDVFVGQAEQKNVQQIQTRRCWFSA